MAEEAGIPSFNQQISEVGPLILETLTKHYDRGGAVPFKQYDFRTTLEER